MAARTAILEIPKIRRIIALLLKNFLKLLISKILTDFHLGLSGSIVIPVPTYGGVLYWCDNSFDSSCIRGS